MTNLYKEVVSYLDFAPEGYAEPMAVSALVAQIEGFHQATTYTVIRECVGTALSQMGFLDAAIDSVSGTFYDYHFARTYHQNAA